MLLFCSQSSWLGRRLSNWLPVALAVALVTGVTQDASAQRNKKKSREAQATQEVAPRIVADVAVDPSHPLAPAIKLAEQSHAAIKEVQDYTCVFSKREVLGKKMKSQVMLMKFKQEPFSVYMLYDGQEKGREILFVEGQNENKLLVHESGVAALVGTLSLPLNSPQVTAENKYPVTQIGMLNLVDTILHQWRAEAQFGEVEVKPFPAAKVDNRECEAMVSTHPTPRKDFKFHRTVLYVDKETKFPVRVEQYGFPRQPGEQPTLVEQYTYSQIRINTGLTAADFDARNRSYNFK